MPGRQRIRNPLAVLSQHKVSRPRRRQDVRSLSRKERLECERLTTISQSLAQHIDPETTSIPDEILQDTASKYNIPIFELLQLVTQFVAYTKAHPTDTPATAFAPLLQPQKKSSHSPATSDAIPRRRPHISSIKDEKKRQDIIDYATVIMDLVRLQNDVHILPEGKLDDAAGGLKISRDWVEREMKHLRRYRHVYGKEKDYTDYNAFTPLRAGRPKGRKNSGTDIEKLIEEAAINKRWPSFSGDGSVDEARQPIGPKLIHSLVEHQNPNAQSESTTWRMYNDFRRMHPALFAAARGGVEYLQKIYPWIKNKVGGSLERIQLDVRPLPIVADIGNGVRATVRAILIVDDFSDYKPVWHAMPAKRLDTNEEVHRQDYTARKCRELTAIAFLRVQKRSRIVYADNGSTFLWDSLFSYMPFLVYPDEDPTLLIHRRPERPRGGGNVENELKFVTNFLQFRPSYILEKDYRRSYAEGRNVNVPTMEKFLIDFDAFMNYNNQERVNNKPSCLDRYNEVSNRGLTLPAVENLVMFGSGERIEPRRPNPGGFKLDHNFYVPYRQDPELALALADVVERAKKDKSLQIPLRICSIGEFTFIFFSLDNEQTWELAIDKDRGDPTWKTQAERLKGAEEWVTQKGNEAAQFFKVLLSAQEEPIVLNGLRRQHRFEKLEQARSDLEALKQSPDSQITPRDLGDILAVAQTPGNAEPGTSTERAKEKTTERQGKPRARANSSKRKQSSTADHTQSPQITSSLPTPEPTLEAPTDNDDFLSELNRRLGLG